MSTADYAPGLEIKGDASDLVIGIVTSAWHADIVAALVEGAQRVTDRANAATKFLAASGALELPILAQELARDCDAVIALGVVVRGETAHFDYVWQTVAQGLLRVSLDTQTPVTHGVLTTENRAQAEDRCGLPGSSEDKGGEAAAAAINTVLALREVRSL